MKLTLLYGGLLVLVVAVALSYAASSSPASAIKSNSKTWMKDAVRRSVAGRQRRAVSPMTAVEINEVVDHHNALRATEGASNMELMVRKLYS